MSLDDYTKAFATSGHSKSILLNLTSLSTSLIHTDYADSSLFVTAFSRKFLLASWNKEENGYGHSFGIELVGPMSY